MEVTSQHGPRFYIPPGPSGVNPTSTESCHEDKLTEKTLMPPRHAPRCLQLHPDRVGARHRCRARETSSRASRADITSSVTSITTGNDAPHAKRHLRPSKHASRGSRSNPTLSQAGNQSHRPLHVASQSSAVGWSRGMRATLLSTLVVGRRLQGHHVVRSARHTPPTAFGVLSFLRGWTSPCFSLSVTVSFSTLLCPRSWS